MTKTKQLTLCSLQTLRNIRAICTLKETTLHSQHLSTGTQTSTKIKILAVTAWGKQKETLLATYKTIMRPVLEYASYIWLLCCCCLHIPLTLVCGGSPIIPLLVHQPAYLSIKQAAPSLQRGLSTNPGVTVWCVCECSEAMVCVVCVVVTEGE